MSAPVLLELAGRINAEHVACQKAAQKALGHALKAGRLLNEAKGQAQHGEWGAWIEANCSFSARTAQLYMRLDRNRAALESEAQRVADLSLREAAKLLAAVPPEVEPSIGSIYRDLIRVLRRMVIIGESWRDVFFDDEFRALSVQQSQLSQEYLREVEGRMDAADLPEVCRLIDELESIGRLLRVIHLYETEALLDMATPELEDEARAAKMPMFAREVADIRNGCARQLQYYERRPWS